MEIEDVGRNSDNSPLWVKAKAYRWYEPNLWLLLISSPSPLLRSDHRRRARLFSLILFVILVTGIIINSLSTPGSQQFFALLAANICLSFAYLASRTRHYKLASSASVFLLWTLTIVSVALNATKNTYEDVTVTDPINWLFLPALYCVCAVFLSRTGTVSVVLTDFVGCMVLPFIVNTTYFSMRKFLFFHCVMDVLLLLASIIHFRDKLQLYYSAQGISDPEAHMESRLGRLLVRPHDAVSDRILRRRTRILSLCLLILIPANILWCISEFRMNADSTVIGLSVGYLLCILVLYAMSRSPLYKWASRATLAAFLLFPYFFSFCPSTAPEGAMFANLLANSAAAVLGIALLAGEDLVTLAAIIFFPTIYSPLFPPHIAMSVMLLAASLISRDEHEELVSAGDTAAEIPEDEDAANQKMYFGGRFTYLQAARYSFIGGFICCFVLGMTPLISVMDYDGPRHIQSQGALSSEAAANYRLFVTVGRCPSELAQQYTIVGSNARLYFTYDGALVEDTINAMNVHVSPPLGEIMMVSVALGNGDWKLGQNEMCEITNIQILDVATGKAVATSVSSPAGKTGSTTQSRKFATQAKKIDDDKEDDDKCDKVATRNPFSTAKVTCNVIEQALSIITRLYCLLRPCNNKGVCDLDDDDGVRTTFCRCERTFTGVNCERPWRDVCKDNGIIRSDDGCCNDRDDARLGQFGNIFPRDTPPKYLDQCGDIESPVRSRNISAIVCNPSLAPGGYKSIQGSIYTEKHNVWANAFLNYVFDDIADFKGKYSKANSYALPKPDDKFIIYRQPYKAGVREKDPDAKQSACTDTDCSCELCGTKKQVMIRPRYYLNEQTSSFDGSGTYGAGTDRVSRFRLSSGGLFSYAFSGKYKYLDTNKDGKVDMVNGAFPLKTMFKIGDRRGNENPLKLALHTLVMLNHNRIATTLKDCLQTTVASPLLFDAARLINVAQLHQVLRDLLKTFQFQEVEAKRCPPKSNLIISLETSLFLNWFDGRPDLVSTAVDCNPLQYYDALQVAFNTSFFIEQGLDKIVQGGLRQPLNRGVAKKWCDFNGTKLGRPEDRTDIVASLIELGRDLGLNTYNKVWDAYDCENTPLALQCGSQGEGYFDPRVCAFYNNDASKVELAVGMLFDGGKLARRIFLGALKRLLDGDAFQPTVLKKTVGAGTILASICNDKKLTKGLTCVKAQLQTLDEFTFYSLLHANTGVVKKQLSAFELPLGTNRNGCQGNSGTDPGQTTESPTAFPTPIPTSPPTLVPTPLPSAQPTPNPSAQPTPNPSAQPTTAAPSTQAPSSAITSAPTPPTNSPTTKSPTAKPTLAPTLAPTQSPTTSSPSTFSPTIAPTLAPTQAPTLAPTLAPTQAPTLAPTLAPTQAPTLAPTLAPTKVPTLSPTTTSPTRAPTQVPTSAPTLAPSTMTPSSRSPTLPTLAPSSAPTSIPTSVPTGVPTVAPTRVPTTSNPVTQSPTRVPTATPSYAPTATPTNAPTGQPSLAPTSSPTAAPTVKQVRTYKYMYDGSDNVYNRRGLGLTPCVNNCGPTPNVTSLSNLFGHPSNADRGQSKLSVLAIAYARFFLSDVLEVLDSALTWTNLGGCSSSGKYGKLSNTTTNFQTPVMDLSPIFGSTDDQNTNLKTEVNRLRFEKISANTPISAGQYGMVGRGTNDVFISGSPHSNVDPFSNYIHSRFIFLHTKFYAFISVGENNTETLFESARVFVVMVAETIARDLASELGTLPSPNLDFSNGIPPEFLLMTFSDRFPAILPHFGDTVRLDTFVATNILCSAPFVSYQTTTYNVSMLDVTDDADTLAWVGYAAMYTRALKGGYSSNSSRCIDNGAGELTFPYDPVAATIQRGRDHAFPSCAEYRSQKGLPAVSFHSFGNNVFADLFAGLYNGNFSKVELSVCMLLDSDLRDRMMGSLIQGVLELQNYSNLCVGDGISHFFGTPVADLLNYDKGSNTPDSTQPLGYIAKALCRSSPKIDLRGLTMVKQLQIDASTAFITYDTTNTPPLASGVDHYIACTTGNPFLVANAEYEPRRPMLKEGSSSFCDWGQREPTSPGLLLGNAPRCYESVGSTLRTRRCFCSQRDGCHNHGTLTNANQCACDTGFIFRLGSNALCERSSYPQTKFNQFSFVTPTPNPAPRSSAAYNCTGIPLATGDNTAFFTAFCTVPTCTVQGGHYVAGACGDEGKPDIGRVGSVLERVVPANYLNGKSYVAPSPSPSWATIFTTKWPSNSTPLAGSNNPNALFRGFGKFLMTDVFYTSPTSAPTSAPPWLNETGARTGTDGSNPAQFKNLVSGWIDASPLWVNTPIVTPYSAKFDDWMGPTVGAFASFPSVFDEAEMAIRTLLGARYNQIYNYFLVAAPCSNQPVPCSQANLARCVREIFLVEYHNLVEEFLNETKLLFSARPTFNRTTELVPVELAAAQLFDLHWAPAPNQSLCDQSILSNPSSIHAERCINPLLNVQLPTQRSWNAPTPVLGNITAAAERVKAMGLGSINAYLHKLGLPLRPHPLSDHLLLDLHGSEAEYALTFGFLDDIFARDKKKSNSSLYYSYAHEICFTYPAVASVYEQLGQDQWRSVVMSFLSMPKRSFCQLYKHMQNTTRYQNYALSASPSRANMFRSSGPDCLSNDN